MLVAWWWLIIAYLMGAVSGIVIGIVVEKMRQSNKRHKELAKKNEYDLRRWQVMRGGK